MLLFDFANEHFDEKDVGRCRQRQGDDRKKLDVADIVHLYEVLDQKKASFPLFVAANMGRIPGLKPLEGDLLLLSATVTDLKCQVQSLVVSTVADLKSQVQSLTSAFNGLQAKIHCGDSTGAYPEMSGIPLIVDMGDKDAASFASKTLQGKSGSGGAVRCATVNESACSFLDPGGEGLVDNGGSQWQGRMAA